MPPSPAQVKGEGGKEDTLIDNSWERGVPVLVRVGVGALVEGKLSLTLWRLHDSSQFFVHAPHHSGLEEALLKMGRGAKHRVVVPPSLGYMARGAPPHVLPTDVLVYEVEVLAFDSEPLQTRT